MICTWFRVGFIRKERQYEKEWQISFGRFEANKKGNDRITDLLESVGLTNRIATNWNEVIRLLEEKTDYSALDNGKFLELLQQIKQFLKKLTE